MSSLSLSAAITAPDAPQQSDKRCKKNERWNPRTQKCECKPGYVRSRLDNQCKSLAQIAEELKREGATDPCKKDIKALIEQFDQLKQRFNLIYSRFTLLSSKFFQQVHTRVSDPCQDGIVAYCYTHALQQAQHLEYLIDDVNNLSSELIVAIGICDLEKEHSISGLLSEVTLLKSKENQIKSGKVAMVDKLKELACDENQLSQLGESITTQKGLDPDFLQDGGSLSEVPGDGSDQDFDGLQDEGVVELAGYNIAIKVYDAGPVKDDVFSLSVAGQGNLGSTPKGGLRSYGLNLPPGTYTATVTTISTEQGGGTFFIAVWYKGRRIGDKSGNIPVGATVSLTFTVN
jgi:hypothetical protein